jgi:hypothetical protein
MAARGILAGSAFVRLGADLDRSGFEQFERETVRAQKVKDINARLGADVQLRDFELYEAKLKEVRAKTDLRKAIKATLGAEYDSRAFNAYYRDLQKADAAARKAAEAPGLLSRAFSALAKSADGAGGSMGGGGGLTGRLGFLGGAIGPLLGTLAALTPVLLAVAGAATAVAGSLAAAAAGAGAVGVGIAAALGPLAAVAGAVAVRVAALTTAYKALGTEQTKGGAQAKASAEQQRAAAERVRVAQDNLTKARFTAKREVEDLTAAVIRSTLAEKDAALALRETQQSSAAVIADPRSSALQRAQAVQDVKDARQRQSDAVSSRLRAIEDEKRGTDTLRQAERQLADARHAASMASEKEGAAATDAGQKLAQLSTTERRLVVDFKAFVDQLTKIFKPATDAIFASVDRGLRLITPLVGRYKGQFAAIGASIAAVVDEAGKSLTGPGWTHALDSFVATAQKLVKPIGDSLGSVLLALRNIAVAAQPYVIELANNIRDALGGLADQTKDPEKVRSVIKGLVDQTKSWLHLMQAVGGLFFTIFSGGARQGQSLVDSLTHIVNRWNAFLGTEDGQRKMRQFFHDSIELTKKIAAFLSDIVGAFYKVGHFLLEHTNLIKDAALAWGGYKVAALAALAVTKGAAVASFIRGPGAAAGASAAGAGAAGAGGAVAAGGLGVGAAATGIGIVALGGYLTLMSQLERKSKQLGSGFQVATSAAKRLAEAGDPEGIRKLSDSIDDWGKKTGATRDQIAKLKDVLADFEQAAERNVGGVGKVLDQAARHFDDFRKTGSNSLHGIHDATADNMHFIKRTLGEDSDAGKRALVGNFKLAAQAVQDAMTDGKIATRDGLKEIRRLMKQELAVYGITGQQAGDYLRSTGHGSGNEARGGGHAAGGWIGMPGMVGTDTVPAMLAPGEAVLNRHQQAVIEGMLGHGFLDDLFANVKTPHYFAQGGRVQPAVAALGDRLSSMFGLQVTSTTGGTHAPGSYHYLGLAEDLGGSEDAMARASAYLMSSGTYRSLLEGIHKPGLSVKNGKTVPSSFWGGVWDQHANHIHIALRTLGALAGGAGAVASKIKTPDIIGGGVLGDLVHGGLARVASGARDRVSAVAANFGGGDRAASGGGLTSAGGKYNKAALKRLWISAGGPSNVANVAAAIALAESGGNPSIVNSIGATGLWQIYGNPFPGNAKDPLTNAKMAVAKYRGAHGFTPWTTYTGADTPNHEKTYLRYLARGGFARNALRFASGGRVGTAWGRPMHITPGESSTALPPGRVNIAQLRGAQRIRVKEYDQLTTSISDAERTYGQAERRYNQSDEILIDPVTGALNQDAIEKRAGELAGLMKIRERILSYLERQLEIARRVVKTYNTIIGRLNRSLQHAKGKDRSGVRADISAYETERDTWTTNAKTVAFDVTDAKLDIGDLLKEGAELRGTTAEAASQPPTDSGAAADSGGTGADTSGTNPDVDAIIAQFQAKADRSASNLLAANQVISAFSSTGDIGTGGSSAFNAVANQAQPVGAQLGGPAGDLAGRAASAGGTTVVNNYNMPGAPDVLRAIGDAATAGQSLQPSVTASVTRLGI